MFSARLLIVFLLLGLLGELDARESFQELRKLLREQQQSESDLQATKFKEDINLWTQSLEEFGLEFEAFVNSCRPIGTKCGKRQVQRHLRALRRSWSELRAQLENLEIKYVGRVDEEGLLVPTLRSVREILQQYGDTLRLVNTEAYKLIEQ